MIRKDTDIWDEPSTSPEEAEKRHKHRKDTDLSEASVSKRQARAVESVSDELPPWEEPNEQLPPDNSGNEGGKKSPSTMASVLSGSILSKSEVTRAYPYMIFVACLMFIYIANIFRTQYIYREHTALTEQVKELRAKSMTIASEKMKATRQTNIMIELKERKIPLEESLTPNKVIPKDKSAHDQGQNHR